VRNDEKPTEEGDTLLNTIAGSPCVPELVEVVEEMMKSMAGLRRSIGLHQTSMERIVKIIGEATGQ
jgi:hypothetical protein